MLNRVTVILEHPEYSALLKVAAAGLRDPAAHLRHTLCTELEHRGPWSPPSDKQDGALNTQEREDVG